MYDLPVSLVVAIAETIHAPLFAQEREDCLVSYRSGHVGYVDSNLPLDIRLNERSVCCSAILLLV
jgi:hypothetical protein